MRGHGRFEALAGAIMLGEANEAEYTCYVEHAAECPRCPDPSAIRTEVLTAIAVARELETWSPGIRDGVVRRIENRRAWTVRWIGNALGIAIVCSLALNGALASGLAQRVTTGLAPIVARLVPFDPLIAQRTPETVPPAR